MGSLILFPGLDSDNIYHFRDKEAFLFQKDLFRQMYNKVKTREQKENVRDCWRYVQKGLMSYDLESASFLFPKRLEL